MVFQAATNERQEKGCQGSIRGFVKTILIRRAEPSEREALVGLQRRASLGNAGDREALLAHPDAIDVPSAQIASGAVVVVERGGRIVGFAALEPREDGDSELDALFVEPDMQRRGIGRALVEHCVAMARARGSPGLYVVGNPHAAQFYTRMGFEVVGVEETGCGPAAVLRKGL